jgi:hypothetical protein
MAIEQFLAIKMMWATHGHACSKSALANDARRESRPSGHRSEQPDHSSVKRPTNKHLPSSRPKAARPSIATSTSHDQHARLMQSTPTTASIEQHQMCRPGSSSKVIAALYDDDETGEYRYKCLVEGCTSPTISRLQDVKRHNDSIHRGLVVPCPEEGCERLFRKDKLMAHARNVDAFGYKG